jgi:hypothetical protein
LESLWTKLRDEFGEIKHLPNEVLITVSYPSSGARGKSEKIKPSEFTNQWTGNVNEKAFLAIHPNYWDNARNVSRAILFGASKQVSRRWGPARVGLHKHDDGTIEETLAATTSKIDKILADVGEPPNGFGLAFPVRDVQRARLEKYVAAVRDCANGTRHATIRAASSSGTVKVALICKDCGCDYVKT